MHINPPTKINQITLYKSNSLKKGLLKPALRKMVFILQISTGNSLNFFEVDRYDKRYTPPLGLFA